MKGVEEIMERLCLIVEKMSEKKCKCEDSTLMSWEIANGVMTVYWKRDLFNDSGEMSFPIKWFDDGVDIDEVVSEALEKKKATKEEEEKERRMFEKGRRFEQFLQLKKEFDSDPDFLQKLIDWGAAP